MMRTTLITRQSLHQGTEALVIYRSDRAYYVVHEFAPGRYASLPDAQFWTYDAAHSRLQHEWHRRHADA
jgi:hypothetical protein